MEVYADIVFAVNFVMDSFILWTVNKLSRRRMSIPRILAGGFIMAFAYCALMFWAPLNIYLNVPASLSILMIGVKVSLKPESVKEFFKLILMSYIASFAIGGIGMALFYFTNMSNIVGNMVGFTVSGFSFKILLASTSAFYIILKLSFGWYKRIVVRKQVFYTVKIFFDECDILLTALLDTGNTLYDPISNSPVIIAEFNAVKAFLPDKLKLVYYENNENDLSELLTNLTDTPLEGRIRMIPFASLGKKNGLIIGFKPDKIEIMNEEGVVTQSDVIVGIYNCRFTSDGAYQGLMHPELLTAR